jgi:hypothetical protein
MLFETEEASIQSDAYIEALLGGHARLPIALPTGDSAPTKSVRHVIRLLETGLPRFHPSFLFEERLAAQLRAAAGVTDDGVARHDAATIDRRLLMGGALASGVSIGAAAVIAWRRRHE